MLLQIWSIHVHVLLYLHTINHITSPCSTNKILFMHLIFDLTNCKIAVMHFFSKLWKLWLISTTYGHFRRDNENKSRVKFLGSLPQSSPQLKFWIRAWLIVRVRVTIQGFISFCYILSLSFIPYLTKAQFIPFLNLHERRSS